MISLLRLRAPAGRTSEERARRLLVLPRTVGRCVARLVDGSTGLILVLVLSLPAVAKAANRSDVSPPLITLSSRDSTFGSNQAALTVEFCDDSSLALTTRSMFLGGTNVRPSFTQSGASKPGCGAYAKYTGTVTLPEGKTWFVVSVDDGSGNTSIDSTYYRYGVTVTPKGIQVLQKEQTDSNHVFTIANPTAIGKTFTLTHACDPSLALCTHRPTIFVNANSQDTAQVLVRTSVPGTIGSLTLTATNGQITDAGYVTITSGVYRLSVSGLLDSAIVLPNRTSEQHTFSISNTGSLTPVAIGLSAICGSPGVPTCVLVGSDTIRNLAVNGTQQVTVSFASGGPSSTGSLAMRAVIAGWGCSSRAQSECAPRTCS